MNAIFGGYGHCIGDDCSAVLGGMCNYSGGVAFTGYFGCNISGVQACAFHANTLVAASMCNGTGGGPSTPGILYYCNIGGVKQIFIS